MIFKDMWKNAASCFPSFLRTKKEEIGFSHVWNLYIHLQMSFPLKKKKRKKSLRMQSSAKPVNKIIKLMAAIIRSNRS